MEKITTAVDLKIAINSLESKQKQEWIIIKEQFHLVYESTLPLNIIKNSIREVSSSPELKMDIFKTGINLLTVFAIKKIVGPAAYTPIAKVIESFLGTAVANRVCNNVGGFKAIGSFLISKFMNKDKGENKIEST